MKTTLVIDDRVMKRLKEEAARRGATLSSLVEAALRAYLRGLRRKTDLTPLPTFRGGMLRVDIADREALDDFLREER
jgi:hypothetical protein